MSSKNCARRLGSHPKLTLFDLGVWNLTGGKRAESLLRASALGTCVTFGGIPAAGLNPSGAVSVSRAALGIQHLINMSACLMNAENITALLAYFMTMKQWPLPDGRRRPLLASGEIIHDNWERPLRQASRDEGRGQRVKKSCSVRNRASLAGQPMLNVKCAAIGR